MSHQLTPNDLQHFITKHGVAARLHHDVGDTPTVPTAAAVLGVQPEQIIKTLVFSVDRSNQPLQPIVVISHGEKRVDRGKLAERYGVAKGRINLAAAEVVLELIGYPVGGVPPFGHRTKLPILVDQSVLAVEERWDGLIFGGGGDHRTMMELHVGELLRVTQAEILAVS